MRLARHPGSDRLAPLVIANADVTDQVWEVYAGIPVHGRLVTNTGAPVAGARVMTAFSGNLRDEWDTTHPDGTFRLTGFAAGPLAIYVETKQGAAPRGGFVIDLPERGAVARDFVLEVGGTVRGTVVDADDNPVSGHEVVAFEAPRAKLITRPPQALTDEHGRFELSNLSTGEYHVKVVTRWTVKLADTGGNPRAPRRRIMVRSGETTNIKLIILARIHR